MSLHATPDGRICHVDMVPTGGSTCHWSSTSTLTPEPPSGTPMHELLRCPACGATALGREVGVYGDMATTAPKD